MKIRIAALRNGQNDINGSVNPAELELDPEVYQVPLTVDVKADRNGGRISFFVQTTGIGRYLCDRCGDDFDMESSGTCQVIFIQRDEALPDETPGDDLRSFRPLQDEIDLSTEVRDALLLELPLRKLCREDCRGLCPNCRANLNREACRCSA